jgi:hypothetical protein
MLKFMQAIYSSDYYSSAARCCKVIIVAERSVVKISGFSIDDDLLFHQFFSAAQIQVC